LSGTRRTPIKRETYPVVTPRAVNLFLNCCRLIASNERDSLDFWRAERALTRELGLKPWHPTVFEIDMDREGPPENLKPHEVVFWNYVRDLRFKLVAAT
jgi:hypothetical protein